MKKYINLAFLYAMLAIAGGVFYREFTKYLAFDGRTTLGFVHVHLFVLGMVVFLIVGLFALLTDVESQKHFKKFMLFYNIGLPFAVVMLIARGVPQVMGMTLAAGPSAAISGLAGIAHILLLLGLIFLFIPARHRQKPFVKRCLM